MRGSLHKEAPAAPPKSTNPTSTKCTARSPCPFAPAASCRKSRSPSAAARSSSPPTPESRGRSLAHHHDRVVVRRASGVGGSGGRGNGSYWVEAPLKGWSQSGARLGFWLLVQRARISRFRKTQQPSRLLSPTKEPRSRFQACRDFPCTAALVASHPPITQSMRLKCSGENCGSAAKVPPGPLNDQSIRREY